MEKAVAATKGKVPLVKVNIDEAVKLADAEGIECVPTIRLYRKGVQTSQFEDEVKVSVLKEWIAWFLAQKPAKRTVTTRRK